MEWIVRRPTDGPSCFSVILRSHSCSCPPVLAHSAISCASMQEDVPESWAPITQRKFNNLDRSVKLKYYETMLVSSGAEHDAHLGPWPFPKSRGPLSSALLEVLKASGQEMWPDWEGESIPQQVPSSCAMRNVLMDNLHVIPVCKWLVAPGSAVQRCAAQRG